MGKLSLGILLNVSVILGMSNPSAAAERLTLYVGPLQFSISVESLETFAAGEQPTGDLALIINRLDDDTRAQVRELLHESVDVSPVVLSRFAYSAMGEDLLQRLGTLVQTQSGINGFYALRSALILAADDEQGLTPLTVLEHFPSDDIRIHTPSIRHVANEVSLLSSERSRTVEAIATQAEQDSAIAPFIQNSGEPDLLQPGPYTVHQHDLQIPISPLSFSTVPATLRVSEMPQTLYSSLPHSPHPLHSPTSLPYSPLPHPLHSLFSPHSPTSLPQPESNEALIADLYLPQTPDAPTPLVVFTHPLASNRSGFEYLGQHLASHGLAVAIPEHQGSNATRLEEFMQGKHRNLVDAIEYPRRSHEVSTLLDALEQHPEFSPQLDFEQVGMMGASYGATIALALAGAELNRDRLHTECTPSELTLNLSILLQCRANELPSEDYELHDSRIQAVFAIFPPTSTIFGSDGLRSITIPTLFVSASQDQLVPAVEEQVQPFHALTAENRYLVLLDPANHYIIDTIGSEAAAPGFLQSDRPDPSIGRSYIQALSVAFFKTHLGNGDTPSDEARDYANYLSAGYAESIRQDDLALYFLSVLNFLTEDPSETL